MPSPQIRRLIEIHQYPRVQEANVDQLAAEHENLVLFFAEDPAKFPESNDVAMILPELVNTFAGQLSAALVDAEAEIKLQQRFGFKSWPALVFLRRGEYLGAITQMQNWDDYLLQVQQLLNSHPSPSKLIPTLSIN